MKQVEVFIAGCPLCDEAVRTVKEVACDSCQVTVYDLREGCATQEGREKAERYAIKRVPTVVVDGKIASCCEGDGVTADALRAEGVGTS
jgi:glutaredoxin